MGVRINNGLKFDEHISNISLEANRKLSALTRLSRKKKYFIQSIFSTGVDVYGCSNVAKLFEK